MESGRIFRVRPVIFVAVAQLPDAKAQSREDEDVLCAFATLRWFFMDDMTAHTIVSTDWLDQNLGSPGLRVLDASWYLPATGRDAWSEYLTAHIPGRSSLISTC
jgi:hypothetical protein